MTRTGRPAVHVHLLPSLIPPGALAGGVAVVVDVLRATTVMVEALASGCAAIVPCGEVDEARTVAAGLRPGSALLAGERHGLPIAGFDLGNSPGDFTPEACGGKTLVMTTTNGTRAILASLDADEVGIGAVVNVDAVTRWAGEHQRPVHLVCAGTEGEVSLEDTYLAGAVADGLLQISDFTYGNDACRVSRDFFVGFSGHVEPRGGRPLWECLAEGRGGTRVREIGLGKDVEAAGRRDVHDLVPVVRRDPLRIVACEDTA